MLGENIKKLRLRQGLTLEAVAKSIGTTRQTVQKYESGIIINIPSDKIEGMSELFKCSPSYLMGWETDKRYHEDFFLEANEKELILQYRKLNATSQSMFQKFLNTMLENS